MMDNVISRISQVEIENIRGFIGSRSINLDADLVILTGPNGFGKSSLIDAICLALTGSSVNDRNGEAALLSHKSANGSVKILSSSNIERTPLEVRVTSKEKVELTLGRWSQNLDTRDAARITVYSQEILDQVLGDEYGQESIVRKLLQPPPDTIQAAQAGIRKGLQIVEGRLREWTAPGVESEELIQRERKEAIKYFRKTWIQIQDSSPELPKLSSDAFLSLQSDNLRKNWQGELRKLVENTTKRAKLEIFLDRDSQPSNMLTVLKQPLKAILHTKLINSTSEEIDSFGILLNQIGILGADVEIMCVTGELMETFSISQQRILPLDHVALQSLRHQTDDWIERRELLRKLLQQIHRIVEGSMPGKTGFDELYSLLHILRAKTPHWIELAREPLDVAPGPVPLKVTHWIEEMVAKSKEPLDSLEEWISLVRERRESLKEELAQLDQTINDQDTLLKVGDILVEKNARFKALREDLLQRPQLSAQDLKLTIKQSRTPESNQKHGSAGDDRYLLNILEATKRWRSVEERDNARLRALEEHQAYKSIRQKTDEVKSTLKVEQSTKGILRSLQEVPPTVRDAFVNSVNKILDRFRLVPGITPIQIKLSRSRKGISWKLGLADGRGTDSLSTGQRALLGIATMVALNLASSSLLNHRILLFDDITTALDMAQLPRAAVLIRQLAYANSTRKELRRQVILSSHHEEMTHRLLDYLLPPPGGTLKVINFTGWDKDKGPSYEVLEGKPRCESLNNITKLLENRFHHLWGVASSDKKRT